ncbi:15795_t:CDS:1, partial [Gigaspora rosea]
PDPHTKEEKYPEYRNKDPLDKVRPTKGDVGRTRPRQYKKKKKIISYLWKTCQEELTIQKERRPDLSEQNKTDPDKRENHTKLTPKDGRA